MLAVVAVGLVVNWVSMRILAGSSEHSLNVKGAYLEVWSDFLGSVAVILGAGVIWLTGWAWGTRPSASPSPSGRCRGPGRCCARLPTSCSRACPPGSTSTRSSRPCWPPRACAACTTYTSGSSPPARSRSRPTSRWTPPSPREERLEDALGAMLAARFGITHSTVQVELPSAHGGREPHAAWVATTDVGGHGHGHGGGHDHGGPPRRAAGG